MIMFRGSSAVEQLAVNQLVAGSNPALGVLLFKQVGFVSYYCIICQLNNQQKKQQDKQSKKELSMLHSRTK